jgi:hypothetical protein
MEISNTSILSSKNEFKIFILSLTIIEMGNKLQQVMNVCALFSVANVGGIILPVLFVIGMYLSISWLLELREVPEKDMERDVWFKVIGRDGSKVTLMRVETPEVMVICILDESLRKPDKSEFSDYEAKGGIFVKFTDPIEGFENDVQMRRQLVWPGGPVSLELLRLTIY